MAINPESQYPGKIAPATSQYPYGAARNISLPGDGTGTPWEASIVNDLFGLQQALLNKAGIVPSGSPDNAENSQYLDALFKLFGLSGETAGVTSPVPQQLNSVHDIGTQTLRKIGRVLEPDPAKTWMNTRVESPAIMWDERDGKYHMVFTGYGTGTGQEQASVGHAVSDNLIDWVVDAVPLLDGTGVPGDPDEFGGTGPYLMKYEGTYYLFYIGLTEAGYEGGTKTLCLATRTSWGSAWTRRGTVIGLGTPLTDSAWRQTAIWHPTINKRGDLWYLFFNASGAALGAGDSNGVERIGFATSEDLLTWTVDDANSPVITTENGSWKSTIAGDPSVYRVGGFWFMNYFGAGVGGASDSIAWTTDEEFPLNWREYSAPYLVPTADGNLDNIYAHKPFVLFVGGKKYHYYTAVNGAGYRTIALAISDTNVGSRHYADKPIVHHRQTPANSYSLDRYSPDTNAGPEFDIVHDASSDKYKIERRESNGLIGHEHFEINLTDVVANGTNQCFLKTNNRFDGVNDRFIEAGKRAYQLYFSTVTNRLIFRESVGTGAVLSPITWKETVLHNAEVSSGWAYDSGWNAINIDTNYTFNHLLGRTPTEVKIQLGIDNGGGAGDVVLYEGWGYSDGSSWRFITTDSDATFYSSTQIGVRTGNTLVGSSTGSKVAATHMRILAR